MMGLFGPVENAKNEKCWILNEMKWTTNKTATVDTRYENSPRSSIAAIGRGSVFQVKTRPLKQARMFFWVGHVWMRNREDFAEDSAGKSGREGRGEPSERRLISKKCAKIHLWFIQWAHPATTHYKIKLKAELFLGSISEI
jgi:hypothetical protein